ncbi:hypothetical protein [Rubrivirga sp.]|uniref:hypothetical protein n=1 Tax=Rubrivirga sp. TaxID=1885344 RepID=UPI003B51A9E7
MHAAVERVVAQDAGGRDRADHRQVLAAPVRNGAVDARAARAVTLTARHRGVRAGLVEEDEPVGVERRLLGDEGRALGRYVVALLLAGAELFLRVSSSRSRVRLTVARLTSTPRSAASQVRCSSSVASGTSSESPGTACVAARPAQRCRRLASAA